MSPERQWEVLNAIYGDAGRAEMTQSEEKFAEARKWVIWRPREGGSLHPTAEGREAWKALKEQREGSS